MSRLNEESAIRFQRELEALDEDLRKARMSSPWQVLIPFTLGMGLGLAGLVAVILVMKML
ncbi:hypothetical protein [Pseudomonas sp. NPDC012596]|uniref:hypothetical protein n=1 Tax=Pseudomonas sp. NPDC012596 TaxID=3364419 RepID=UPI003699A17E